MPNLKFLPQVLFEKISVQELYFLSNIKGSLSSPINDYTKIKKFLEKHNSECKHP